MTDQLYNPLSRINLGRSVAEALLKRPISPMPSVNRRGRTSSTDSLQMFPGAGIYAIYYVGSFPLYELIAQQNRENRFSQPIYIGKADPEGSRTGIYEAVGLEGFKLYERLKEHARSIENAQNLELSDFFCRYLVVEDIWIPLGESLLINEFKPVWNKFGGFGIHQPGKGREQQQCSIWDTLHPGRPWALRLPPNNTSYEEVERMIVKYLQGDEAVPDMESEQ